MNHNLLFDCSYSEMWVHPKDWKTLTSQKSLKLNWYVECKFHDPLFKEKYPKGFPFRKKVNQYPTLKERKAVIEVLLKEIPILLEDKGYNPITKKFMKVVEVPKGELHKELPFIDAFRIIEPKIKCSEKYREQLKFGLNRIEKAVKELRMQDIKIGEIKRSEVKIILEYLKLTPHNYNQFRIFFSTLFNELIEYECCEINPIVFIKKQKITKKIRETLNPQEFELIKDYLRVNYPNFYRYMFIFLLSGSRSSEFFDLKIKDIDIKNQEYKIIIKKGDQYKEYIKVIVKEAIPYWEELVKLSKNKEDYLFSKNLIPGKIQINSSQITKRWYRLIKNGVVIRNNTLIPISDFKEDLKTIKKKYKDLEFINADFYSLKHTFLDSLDSETARRFAGHTNLRTTEIYQVTKAKREREEMKKLEINLLKKAN